MIQSNQNVVKIDDVYQTNSVIVIHKIKCAAVIANQVQVLLGTS